MQQHTKVLLRHSFPPRSTCFLLRLCTGSSLVFLIQQFHNGPDTGIPFAEIAPIGAKILICVGLYQMFDAMLVIFSGALRGAGDTSFAMWACVLCSWCIFVPGTIFVTETLRLGVYAAWVWVFLYSFMLGLTYLKRFHGGRWKSIEVIPNEEITIPAAE